MSMTWPRRKLNTEYNLGGSSNQLSEEAVNKFLLRHNAKKHTMLC